MEGGGRLALPWVCLALLAGCDGGATTGDGGLDAGPGPDGSPAERMPAPPEIPWLAEGAPPITPPAAPQLTPCPAGWREVEPAEPGDVATCDPYPTAGASDCPDGEAHFPGEPGCAPVGAACPAGDWPDGLPDDGSVLFVRPGATGGDGTRALPFGRIGEAMAMATSGTTIALAKGLHRGPVQATRDVTLRGACAGETTLTAGTGTAALVVTGPGIELRDLGVGDSLRIGIAVIGTAASLDMRGVTVRNATMLGVFVDDGASLTAQDVVISDTSESATGMFGRGLTVQEGSAVEASRLIVENNREMGIYISGAGTQVVLADVAVRGTRPAALDGTFGRGVSVQEGAQLRMERALIEANHYAGVTGSNPGTSLVLEDLVVRDTESQLSEGYYGRGIGIVDGASAEVRRVLVEGNREIGVSISGTDTMLTLEDASLRDTRPELSTDFLGMGVGVETGGTAHVNRAVAIGNRTAAYHAQGSGSALVLTDVVALRTHEQASDGMAGVGISSRDGASVTVTRARVADCRAAAAAAAGSGSALSLSEVVLRDTRHQVSDGESGLGLLIQEGATAEASHVVMEANLLGGAMVEGAGSRGTLTDVVVRDTRPAYGSGEFGRGLAVQRGATVELTRGLIESSRVNGAFVHGPGTSLTARDAVIRDTWPQESDGFAARGLSVITSASADVQRARIEQSRGMGVLAFGDGAVATLRDVSIVDTSPRDCCPESPFGHGVVTVERASIALDRFLVGDSHLCGLMVARDGQLRLSNGEVARNPVGVCLQSPGFDVAQLTDGVLFRDNATTMEATSFGVPSADAPNEL